MNLPSIFKEKSVISYIASCFENKESPIICYNLLKLFVNKNHLLFVISTTNLFVVVYKIT